MRRTFPPRAIPDQLWPLAIAGFVTAALFSSVLLHERILAIGDGLIESVPGFAAPFTRWQPNMFAGFAVYADPNKAFWYPLRLLHFVPAGFNAYLVAAYVIAAWATYGYVRSVANSIPAGIASALTFAYGGFLIAHLGHPMIVEPACWFCAALWAVDSFLRTRQSRRLIMVFASLYLCLTAGQPQIAAFAIPILMSYLAFIGFHRSLRETIPVYLDGFVAIVLGVAAAAMAWLPTIALGTRSVRASLDFASFVLDSTTPNHIALNLIYPFAGGGGARGIYSAPVVASSGSFVETANYIPLAAIVLALLAPFSGRPRLATYWAFIACIGLALSVGSALPLASIVFHVPGFNLFRIPGRHAFEFTFAVAVLAGLGVKAIGKATVGPVSVCSIAIVGGLLVAIATSDVAAQDATFDRAPSVTIFLFAAVTQVALVLAAALFRCSPAWRVRFACSAVTIGTATFATTAYWQDAPPAAILQPPAYARLLQHLPLATGQRIYTEGDENHVDLLPNLPSIWAIPEVGGYTPLQDAVSHIFLQTGENGRLLNVDSPLIDASAVRYVATPAQPVADLMKNARFGHWDLGDFLSAALPNAPRSLTFGLSRPLHAQQLALVTSLGTSVGVRQGTRVATVIVRGSSGTIQEMPLRAGIETAEFAYDRPDVLAAVRHRKAAIFERDGVLNWYVTVLPLRLREPIASVTIGVNDPVAALNVRKISLIDASGTRAYPFSAAAKYYGNSHFRHVDDVAGVAIFENLRSSPAVWIARAVPLSYEPSSDEARAALRERLMRIDLRKEALVTGVARPMHAGAGNAVLVSDSPERRDVDASCWADCLLVSSMTFTNDWRVNVDGRPATLLRADGFLQAVAIPAGRHAIAFRYAPATGRYGLLVSGASTIALFGFVAWRKRFRLPRER